MTLPGGLLIWGKRIWPNRHITFTVAEKA